MLKKKRRFDKSSVLFLMLLSVFFLNFIPSFIQPCFGVRMDKESLESSLTSPESLPPTEVIQRDPKVALLALAEARLRQGKWQEAVRYASEVLSMEPKQIRAHGILGTIHALTGQEDLAQRELAALKGATDQDFYPELIQAILSAQEGKLQEAERHLASVLLREPGHPVGIYYAGSLKLAQGDLGEAEKSFKAVIASQPDFSAALAGLGQIALQQKKTTEASKYYKEAIEKEPEILLYRRQLIEIYQATGQKDAANREIKELLYYTPGVKQAYLKQGMQLLSQGAYRDAIALMDKVLGIYKRVPQALYIKAAAQVNLRETKVAVENIQGFISQQWASPQAHHYAGMCYLALEDIKRAESQFKTAISLNPNMGRSFVPLTIIEQLRGNHDLAMQGLSIARSGGEPPALVHYLAAHVLLAKGDQAKYLKEMKRAVGLIPGLGQNVDFVVPERRETARFAADRNLMALYFYNGWYGKAIDYTDMLLKLNKNDRFGWYYKALSEIAQKRTKRAIHAFRELAEIEPNLLSAHTGLGQLYMQNNDYQNALKSFKKAIEIDPEYGPAYVGLGDAYLNAEEERQAIISYRKGIEFSPKSPEAYRRLALILAEKPKELDEALKLATKAEEVAPEDPFSLDALGWVYVKQGKTEKAIEKLNQATKLRPQNPLFQYHLGVAYFKNNELTEAKRALQAALNISRDFKGAVEAQRIFEKIR